MSTTRDLPYYNGQPAEIGPLGWLALMGSVVVAFALLITLPFPNFPLNLIPAVIFTGLPLLTLAAVTGGKQGALFGAVGFKQIGTAIGFGILTFIVSITVGLALAQVTTMTANPVAETLSDIDTFDTIAFLLRTFIQLIGEELLTILPLLAVLWLCVRRFKLPKAIGLTIAVVLSTLWFASVHLPTYNWNLIQCIGVIGSARLVLTMAFLVSRNLWVSAGAHILNDWTEFLLPMLLGGHAPIDPSA